VESVCSAVRTESLYKTDTLPFFKGYIDVKRRTLSETCLDVGIMTSNKKKRRENNVEYETSD
jgi:hypothetical protein